MLFTVAIQTTSGVATAPVPFRIVVIQPAYVGEPIWVTATSGPIENVRYPFHAAMEDAGCRRIEVKRGGVPLAPLPLLSQANFSGLVCGSSAPAGSPPHRLPLHALFALDTPGTYAVRWTELSSQATSDWLAFDVRQPTPEQREAWLTGLLAHPPENAGLLAGDFLPSLLAGVPDRRVLETFVRYLHAEDPMVSGMAAAGLEHFPLPEVRPAVADSIVHGGPSAALASFATFHGGWSLSEEDRVVHAAIPYLRSAGSPVQSAAAYSLLELIFYVPNNAWPANPVLKAFADREVLQAAPKVMESSGMESSGVESGGVESGGVESGRVESKDGNVLGELANYLGSMSSPRAHELLWQMAERPDGAGEQARMALTWHPEAADLPRLAAVLTAPGDSDSRGTDRSSLPSALMKSYGDAALPYLERAVRFSPYIWVRTQSAEVLALQQRPLGFQFLLEAVEGHEPYRAEMTQWVRSSFRDALPPGATDLQLAGFLRSNAEASGAGREEGEP